MTSKEWAKIGDTVCDLLTTIYVTERKRFEQESARRNIDLEQLAAAAVIALLQERIEQQRAGRETK